MSSEERVVEKITPVALLSMLLSNLRTKVIDVRDNDYGNFGVIKGSTHIQASEVNTESMKKLIADCSNDHIDEIVFYCEYGCQRSPRCANIANSVINQMDTKPLLQISFLEGGFSEFRAKVPRSDLIAKADK